MTSIIDSVMEQQHQLLIEARHDPYATYIGCVVPARDGIDFGVYDRATDKLISTHCVGISRFTRKEGNL